MKQKLTKAIEWIYQQECGNCKKVMNVPSGNIFTLYYTLTSPEFNNKGEKLLIYFCSKECYQMYKLKE